jgi:hypothetical protein
VVTCALNEPTVAKSASALATIDAFIWKFLVFGSTS